MTLPVYHCIADGAAVEVVGRVVHMLERMLLHILALAAFRAFETVVDGVGNIVPPVGMRGKAVFAQLLHLLGKIDKHNVGVAADPATVSLELFCHMPRQFSSG